VIRLYTTKTGWFREATTRRGAQNLGDHKQRPPPTSATQATARKQADQSRTAARQPDARPAPSL